MNFTIAPGEQDVFLTLWTFLTQILPSGDAIFTGSIAGDQLTVTEVTEGTIKPGDQVLGVNVASGTFIADMQTATGGVGVYKVSPDQGSIVVDSSTMSTGVEIIQGQVNRVPEPKCADYVIMWVLRFPRLSTNVDDYADVTFTGEITGTVLTVTGPLSGGNVQRGLSVFGAGVHAGTTINAYGNGSGGLGTYSVVPGQTVGPVTMAAGSKTATQSVEAVLQMDVHGPNSNDFSQIISTLFRDEYATEAFAALNAAVAPLFADDPKQMPFTSGEQQYENRYIIEAHLQVNQTVTVSQQFADELEVITQSVDTLHPTGDGPSLDFSDPDNSQLIPGV